MANSRPKAPKFTTPKMIFRFPKLSEVDFGTKDYPKEDGEYSVTGIMTASDPKVQAFIKKLEPLYQQAVANGEVAFKALKAETRKKLGSMKANPLFTELLDQETEEPTGEITMKFAMKASGQYKKGPKTDQFWDSRPAIFDRKTNTLVQGFRFRDRAEDETIADVHVKGKPAIWGGTTGYVSFEVGLDKDGEPGYFIPGTGAAGLKLALTAVQVIDIVSAGQASADSYGFGREDGDEDEDGETSDKSASDDDNADF